MTRVTGAPGHKSPTRYPISPQLRKVLAQKGTIRWDNVPDPLLRELFAATSHDCGGKPVWWLSSNDFIHSSLPSIGRRLDGLANYLCSRDGGRISTERGRKEILKDRLGIPKPTFAEEREYFLGLAPYQRFCHWKEATDDFLRYCLETAAEEKGKPAWWLTVADLAQPFSAFNNRTLDGLAFYLYRASGRNLVALREKIIGERLGIPKPSFEEEWRFFFSLPLKSHFRHWDDASDSFLVYILAIASLNHGKSPWELSHRDLTLPLPLLKGRSLYGLLNSCRDGLRRNFQSERVVFLNRLLQNGRYQINFPGILLSTSFPPHPDTLLIETSA